MTKGQESRRKTKGNQGRSTTYKKNNQENKKTHPLTPCFQGGQG